MKTFEDAVGRKWEVRVDIDAVKRVRDQAKFDLLDISDGRALEKLIDDPVMLCDVLFVLCRESADKREISDEDFGRSLLGDAIDRATEALVAELVDFFPSRKRVILAKALATVRTIEARMHDRALAALDSPELAAKIESLLTFGGSSGTSPQSADSTPAGTPSAS